MAGITLSGRGRSMIAEDLGVDVESVTVAPSKDRRLVSVTVRWPDHRQHSVTRPVAEDWVDAAISELREWRSFTLSKFDPPELLPLRGAPGRRD